MSPASRGVIESKAAIIARHTEIDVKTAGRVVDEFMKQAGQLGCWDKTRENFIKILREILNQNKGEQENG